MNSTARGGVGGDAGTRYRSTRKRMIDLVNNGQRYHQVRPFGAEVPSSLIQGIKLLLNLT